MPTNRKCLFCQNPLDKQSLMQYMMNDVLCVSCRRSLKIKKRTLQMKDLKITYFGFYEGNMAEMLLQYKECMDEALKDVFLHEVKEWIRFHYHHCVFLCAPSSRKNLEKRGFQHVVSMFEQCGIPILDCFEKQTDTAQKETAFQKRAEIADILTLRKDIEIPDKRLILIDDIVTTGSTLLALQHLLKDKHCTEALCLCIHPKLFAEYDKKRRRICIY